MPPIGHLLFTFPLLLKYKTDFPVIINLSQRITARAVRSFAAMFFEREMLHGCGLVRTTWRSVDRLDRTRKERSFTVLNIQQSRHSIHSSWFFSGRCINRHWGPKHKRVLFVLILKRKIGDQNFPSGNPKFWFVFCCEGKILLTIFFSAF